MTSDQRGIGKKRNGLLAPSPYSMCASSYQINSAPTISVLADALQPRRRSRLGYHVRMPFTTIVLMAL